MTDAFIQFGMAIFGLTALWWAMGTSPQLRRWAPVVGLAGQFFWFTFAWIAAGRGVDVRGLLILCVAYSAVYTRGVFIQWRAA